MPRHLRPKVCSPEMTTPQLPAGYSAIEFESIDSTNEEAKRLGMSGQRGPVWIYAKTQTAGRGRRGREWISPPGNLMTTLLLAPQATAQEAAKLSFVAALAVHDAVSSWLPDSNVQVKWPNDVLVDGKKVAGILLEASSAGETTQLPWLAVGIGINLAHAPDLVGYPATFVNDHGTAVDVAQALSVLAQTWETRLRVWRTSGFEAIRQAWIPIAAGIGQVIEVRLAQERLTGTFETLMSDGALSLLLPSGQRRAITAGEVFFAPVGD